MAQPKKKLYALLVGIDEYQPSVPIMPKCTFGALAGCVNDAQNMLAYLKAEDGFDLKMKFLKNEKATKEAVVQTIKTHLGQAREGDVTLFYYSGHGIQEYADPKLWKEETDGRLECIVCYNEKDKACLLADKELRYLIREIATGTKDKPKEKPPHILTIFDCCHSGGNTRNGFMTNDDTRERRVKCIAPQRKWPDFIFKDILDPFDLKTLPLSQTLPEGIHLHLAACESDESALEVNGKGVFTSYLTNILKRAQGNITYYDLMSQVRHYLKNTFSQKPQLHLTGEDSSGNYATFLNKTVSSKPLYGNVIYNQKNGWVLDMGSLMGISQQIGNIEVTGPIGKTYSARIQRIQPDETRLKFRGPELPDQRQVYKATVKGLMAHPVKIFINNYDGNPEMIKILLEKMHKLPQNIILTENQSAADYTLQVRGFSYYITKPNDVFRPLILPVQWDDLNAIDTLVNYLHHISQWEFVRRLKNAHTYLFKGNPIKVEIFPEGQSGPELSLESKIVDLQPRQRADGKWIGKVALKLTNTTSRKLYVSTLYLPIEFRVFLKGIDPQVYSLEPDESVWVFNWRKGEIGFSLDDIAKDYNWKFTEEFLKIIVSTTPFDVARLEKKGLPKPRLLSDDNRGNIKGLDVEEETPEMEGDDWTTQDITLSIHNPLFNQITKNNLLEMLETPSITPFALGLYFDYSEQKGFQKKQGIKVMDSNGNEITSLAQIENFAAEKNKLSCTNNYKKRHKHFGNLSTLITWGDGWLHNPTVRNLTPHFNGYFNVYPFNGTITSVGTLEQVISNSGASHLVVSSGAAEMFQNEPGSAETLVNQLEDLASKFSNLKILIHGYDYFNFKTNQTQSVKLTVDQFNETLQTLTAKHPRLTYLDLRGSLNDKQWKNETLPNDDGFEKLAGQFLSFLIHE